MGTRSSPAQVEGFLDELRARASVAPDSVALLSPGQDPITYRELLVRIEALAGTLMGSGLKRKDVVAVSLPDGIDFVALALAIPSVAVCAPLNPAFSKTELEAEIGRASCRQTSKIWV